MYLSQEQICRYDRHTSTIINNGRQIWKVFVHLTSY